MDVWIEILQGEPFTMVDNVTSYMDVWIEIPTSNTSQPLSSSHPIWMCGLKYDSKIMVVDPISYILYGCVD